MTDTLHAAEAIRNYYNSNALIRSYVDLHYYLSLMNADILPEPADEWLRTLSEGVLDYWKIGECHIARHEDKLICCDPTTVASAATNAEADNIYDLVPPDSWTKSGKPKPTPLLYKPNPYSRRGESIVQKHVFVLLKAAQSGTPTEISHVTFGFGSQQSTKEALQDVMDRVRMFRNKLLRTLLKLWPEWQINFYPINANDVLEIAKNVGMLKK